MKTPEVSVLIPTHNRPRLLARALKSVRAQQGPSFEIVVIDDGDGSGAALARSLGETRLVVLSSGRAGQVSARNLGLGAARGAVIAWLDDDDWWEGSTHLRDLLATVSATGGVASASGLMILEDNEQRETARIPFTALATAETLKQDNTLWVSGLAYPKALHAAWGLFDESLPCYWDWDWYLRLAAAGVPFALSASQAVRCSARNDNVSSAGNQKVRAAELERLCARHGLGALTLKNHADIAREQGAGRDTTG